MKTNYKILTQKKSILFTRQQQATTKQPKFIFWLKEYSKSKPILKISVVSDKIRMRMKTITNIMLTDGSKKEISHKYRDWLKWFQQGKEKEAQNKLLFMRKHSIAFKIKSEIWEIFQLITPTMNKIIKKSIYKIS